MAVAESTNNATIVAMGVVGDAIAVFGLGYLVWWYSRGNDNIMPLSTFAGDGEDELKGFKSAAKAAEGDLQHDV